MEIPVSRPSARWTGALVWAGLDPISSSVEICPRDESFPCNFCDTIKTILIWKVLDRAGAPSRRFEPVGVRFLDQWRITISLEAVFVEGTIEFLPLHKERELISSEKTSRNACTSFNDRFSKHKASWNVHYIVQSVLQASGSTKYGTTQCPSIPSSRYR